VWDSLKQLEKFTVSVIGYSALPAEVMMIGWNKLGERHLASRHSLQKIHYLSAELRELLVHSLAFYCKALAQFT